MAHGSGVYYVVKHVDFRTEDQIFHITPGGYPHLTVGYLDEPRTAQWDVALVRISAALHLERALHVLVFDRLEISALEKAGKKRYDLLLMLADEDKETIEADRKLLETLTPGKWVLRPPHVTLQAFSDKEEAERALDAMGSKLPVSAVVTGVMVK